MTWKELKEHIEVMDNKQLNTDVLILDCRDGYFCETSLEFLDEPFDGMNENCPYLSYDR